MLGWHGHDLELRHALGAVAVAGAHAVAAGVAAADDDDVLALGVDGVLQLVAGVGAVLLRQQLHGEVHAVQLAPRYRQVARLLGAAGQQHGVEVLHQLRSRHGFLGQVGDLGAGAFARHAAHQHAGAEGHALGLHLRHALVDVRLVELEVGDAVAQQAADAVVLLEQGHGVAGARQLLRRRQAGRAGADHGDFLAGLTQRRARHHPALGPGAVDDGVLDRLDAHRVVVDVQHAGRLARRRADAAGELGEVVGAVEHVEGVLPVAPVHQVIEVRNDVVDRAAVVAERRAAVHAARALLPGLRVIEGDDEFLVVLQALGHGRVALVDALEFHEAGDFSHDVFLQGVLFVRMGEDALMDSGVRRNDGRKIAGGQKFLSSFRRTPESRSLDRTCGIPPSSRY